jgi:hypothetical protein
MRCACIAKRLLPRIIGASICARYCWVSASSARPVRSAHCSSQRQRRALASCRALQAAICCASRTGALPRLSPAPSAFAGRSIQAIQKAKLGTKQKAFLRYNRWRVQRHEVNRWPTIPKTEARRIVHGYTWTTHKMFAIGQKRSVAARMSLPPQLREWAIPLMQYGARFIDIGRMGQSDATLLRRKR